MDDFLLFFQLVSYFPSFCPKSLLYCWGSFSLERGALVGRRISGLVSPLAFHFFWWSFVSQLVSDLSASLSLFCLPLLSCVPHLSPNLLPSSLLAMVVPRVTPTVFFCRLLVFSLLLLLSPTERFCACLPSVSPSFLDSHLSPNFLPVWDGGFWTIFGIGPHVSHFFSCCFCLSLFPRPSLLHVSSVLDACFRGGG